MSCSPDILRRRRAVTLVELLVALSILAVMSTAVATLLNGAGRTHQYVNKETDALQQVETAYRRMLHNLRTAASMTAPTGTTATNTFTVTTQNDSTYGGSATIRYYVDPSGNLVEDDPRYNVSGSPNVLVYNVKTFTVKRETTVAPTEVTILLQSDTQPVITRTARITCRNF